MTIQQKLSDIEIDISKNWCLEPFCSDLSLFTGLSGLPIFYYQFYKYTGNDLYLQKAEEIIEFIFDNINNSNKNITSTFCNGIAGIGFMLNYMEKTRKILNIDFVDGLKVIDDVVVRDIKYFLEYVDNLDHSAKMNQIDYLHGAFGLGYYLLKRIGKNNVSEIIIILFEKISEIVQIDFQIAINQQDLNDFEEKHYSINLGLAHGHASYILLFIKFLEIFPENKMVKDGLNASIETILLFMNENEDDLCLFPSIAINKKTGNYNDTHLGWCYGDQSISFALFKAGKLLNNEVLIKKAESIAIFTQKRDSIQLALSSSSDKKYDAGFCHGTTSVAYLHKIWFDITHKSSFLVLYKSFTTETLLVANHENSLSGYKKRLKDNKYSNAIGLLDGIAGVGVFFMDSLLKNNSKNTKWSSIFLLD